MSPDARLTFSADERGAWWVVVPRPGEGTEAWRAAAEQGTVEALAQADPADSSASAADVRRPASAIVGELLEIAASLSSESVLVASYATPDGLPMAALVSSWPRRDDLDLLALVGATGKGLLPTMDAPAVDYTSDDVGDGVRVVRREIHPDGTAGVAVAYARRDEAAGRDTAVLWRSLEVDRLGSALVLLDGLMAALRVEELDGTEAAP